MVEQILPNNNEKCYSNFSPYFSQLNTALKDSSRSFRLNCVISFIFYLYLMLYACVKDSMWRGMLKNFANFFATKQGLSWVFWTSEMIGAYFWLGECLLQLFLFLFFFVGKCFFCFVLPGEAATVRGVYLALVWGAISWFLAGSIGYLHCGDARFCWSTGGTPKTNKAGVRAIAHRRRAGNHIDPSTRLVGIHPSLI
jgi:hypothetical protein